MPETDPMTRLLEEGIKPNTEALAPIVGRGRVAVLVFEPALEMLGLARTLGWDGSSAVVALSERTRTRLVQRFHQLGDPVTANWLRPSHRVGRVFVVVQRATFLLNFVAGEGWSTEPGSTDAEFLS